MNHSQTSSFGPFWTRIEPQVEVKVLFVPHPESPVPNPHSEKKENSIYNEDCKSANR